MGKNDTTTSIDEVELESNSSLSPLPPAELPTPKWVIATAASEGKPDRSSLNGHLRRCAVPDADRFYGHKQEEDGYLVMYGYGIHPLTRFLIFINGQLQTAFTVVFVTVMTTLLKRLTLWRAQRGASVVTLEQYQASVSLPSTIKTVLSLRAFTLQSLGLIVVWYFYYLGSQASAREFGLQQSGPTSEFPIWVPKFEKASVFAIGLPVTTQAAINGDFQATISIANGGQNRNALKRYDFAGRPLIPDTIEFLEGDLSLDEFKSSVGFEGIPHNSAAGSPPLLVGHYDTQMSYFRVTCGEMLWSANTSLDLPTTQSLDLAPLDDDSVRRQNNYGEPRGFVFRSKGHGGISSMTCNITMISLNISVNCKEGNCAVIHSSTMLNNGEEDSKRTPFDDTTLFTSFLRNLALSTGLPPDNKTSSQLEYAWSRPLENQTLVNMTETYLALKTRILGAVQFHPSLQDLINTYYMLYLKYGLYWEAGPDMSHMTKTEIIGNISQSGNWTISNMTGASWQPNYGITMAWIVIDFLSCCILLAAAVISIFLRRTTIAPDIFGYVSSATRENPHIPLPDGGSSLSGFERTRMMRGVKIKITDVSQDGEVGRIGVALARPGAANAHAPSPPRLQKGRAYL